MSDSLAEARAFVEAGKRAGGVTCPCCDQFAKVYRRKLNSAQARLLISFYRRRREEWVHIGELGLNGGDAGKLALYGLLESRLSDRPDGNPASGFWRITPRGCAFVEGSVRVPEHVFVYNGEAVGFSSTLVGIGDALGRPFRYEEVMQPALFP